MKLRASIVCTAILLLSLDTAGQDREVAVHRPDSSGVRPISTDEAYRLACAHNEMTENMQYDEALENYRIALEYISMCDLSDSTALVTKDIIEYNIASVHADMAAEEAYRTGNFTEAIELTEKALAMFADIYGTENEEYANGLNLLADYCYNNGEYGKAIDYGKEAAEITLELSGEQDTGYAVLIYNLGMYHSYSGDFRTAIPYFEEATGILEKTDRVMYARCIEDLSDCHDALGDYGKAVEYLTEATDLLSDMDDEESMKEYIYGLKELASLYSTLNDYPEALELATKAAGLQESRFGENTEEYIDILKDISDYNLSLGYFPASNEALEKAAVLGEEVFDKYSIKYIGMLVDLGGRQYSSGEYAKAGATFTDVTGKMQHILSEPDRLSPADKLLLVKQYYKFLDVFLEASLEVSYQAAESTANEFLQAMQDAGQDIPAGTCCAAVRHSASTFLCVEIEGKSAHAARPHLGVNCAEAAALITNAICAIKMNPALTWSCKVTSISAVSSASNIIPDRGELVLDVRAQTNELMDDLLEKVRRAIEGAASSIGAKATIKFPGGVIPAAIYDEDLVAEVAQTIKEELGADKLAPDCGGGGEDFHYFKQTKPHMKAAYFGLGAGCTPGLHARNMTFDTEQLAKGVKVLVAMALKKLS